MSSLLYQIRVDKANNYNWLYYFHQYSLNDFKKTFSLKNPTLYGTTHTKKITTSLQNHFLHKLTPYSKPYLHYLFQPSNEGDELVRRERLLREFFQKTIDCDTILSTIPSLNPLSYNSNLYIQGYTTQENIKDYFYNTYGVSLLLIGEEEAEEVGEQSPDSVYVGDKYLLSFEHEYKPDEFESFLRGHIYNEEKTRISNLLYFLRDNHDILNECSEWYNSFFQKEFLINSSLLTMISYLEESSSPYSRAKEFVDELRVKIDSLNEMISKDLKEKTISLSGEEVVALLEQKATTSLKEKISSSYETQVEELNTFITNTFLTLRISPKSLLKSNTYPFELDEEEISAVMEEAASKGEEDKRKYLQELGSFATLDYIDELFGFCYFFELMLVLKKEFEGSYSFISHNQELLVENLSHFFLPNPTPVSYSLGSQECEGVALNSERVSLITGANSGGKTTLVESIMQAALLTSMGFPIKADSSSSIPYFNKITYLKKFTGTQGSGAFEQTLKQILELLEDDDSNQLIVVDELEAVTEPGAAATILLSFLRELSKQGKYAIAISHLGEELENLLKQDTITSIRIDGISAEGLDDNGKLITNHQPHFYSRGKSTPELIMKRVLMDEKFWKNKSTKTKEIFTKLLSSRE